jgi:hypothetical protein
MESNTCTFLIKVANRAIKFCLDINTMKTKYMVVSRKQSGGQNHNLLTASKSPENVAKFKYLGTTVTCQN